MRRRTLLIATSTFAFGATLCRLPALAQRGEARPHRIAMLAAGNPRSSPQWQAFDQRLHELGYAEGRNLITVFRDAEGKVERFVSHATELVGMKPDLIVATGPEPLIAAMRNATTTIPVVMVAVDYDPVAAGHVASLARPGGNMSGITFRQVELSAKRLDLLKEALPGLRRVSVFWDVNATGQMQSAQAAAAVLGLAMHSVELRDPPYDFETAFAAAAQQGSTAVMVGLSPAIYRDRTRVARLALARRMPAVFPLREFVEDGGLLSFGVNFSGEWRRAAGYVDRILKGAKPADLPVEQPTTFELVVNLRTARELGLTLSNNLLARADAVID